MNRPEPILPNGWGDERDQYETPTPVECANQFRFHIPNYKWATISQASDALRTPVRNGGFCSQRFQTVLENGKRVLPEKGYISVMVP